MPTDAGDFDYSSVGAAYAPYRRADPRIEAIIHGTLGHATSVLNVGAGAGSYEPADRDVVAVEPSADMRAQRRADSAPVLCGVAEHLPFDNGAFDASMSTVSVHQWRDPIRGMREMRRVTRGPIVILTFDGDDLDRFWLADYVPELIEAERKRYPAIDDIRTVIGTRSQVSSVPIPLDCTDGFTEAYFGRPEQFLDPGVRKAQSAWGFVNPVVETRAVDALGKDLESGAWDERHGALRTQPTYIGSLRLVVGYPGT